MRWLKSQRTTKLASEEVACWAEATGAFHHISAAMQAAAAATPKTKDQHECQVDLPPSTLAVCFHPSLHAPSCLLLVVLLAEGSS